MNHIKGKQLNRRQVKAKKSERNKEKIYQFKNLMARGGGCFFAFLYSSHTHARIYSTLPTE